MTSTQPAPQHIAIIMDGNGRWARERGLSRTQGHRRGMEALRRCVQGCGDLGVQYLTLYAFSAENWQRPASEISDLFGLLKYFIHKDLSDLHSAGVKIRIIGERKNVPSDILDLLDSAEHLTRENQALGLTVAFNYGARQEILRAIQTIAVDAMEGRLDPHMLDIDKVSGFLSTAGTPDPDLLIRTSGEQRLSNFLLWQMAYTELVFLPVCWPDFDRQHLEEAIEEYHSRERRYGGLSEVQSGKNSWISRLFRAHGADETSLSHGKD